MECDMRPMVVTYDHWSRWGIPRDSVDRVYAYDVRPVVVEYDEWFNCDQWACNTTSGRDGVYLDRVDSVQRACTCKMMYDKWS